MYIGDLLAQITGDNISSPAQATLGELLPLKRKSEDYPRRAVSKTPQATINVQNGSRKEIPIRTTPNVKANTPRTKLASNVKSEVNINGSIPNITQDSTATPITAQKPLKKGSYAEIMARGKAAHASLGQVGKIQHKKIERQPTKREREDLKSQRSQKLLKNPNPNSKFQKSGQNKVHDTQKVPTEAPKKVKKAALATTGYTGTARPKTNSVSKPLRGSESVFPTKIRHNKGGPSERRYKYLSEEDEDDEEEEQEENYIESDLSDMEAATFEVDEEEEIASKIARREDAEALAEENRLKREKEVKRRKLAAMAKSRTKH